MKFGQLIEQKKEIIKTNPHEKEKYFFRQSCKNEAGRLVPDFFCFLKKLYMR